LGHVFLQLMRYIGKEFNPSLSIIRARLVKDKDMRVDEFPRKISGEETPRKEHGKDHVVIEDVYGNNLARTCFRFYEIQSYFAQATSSVQQILLESGRSAANYSFFEDEFHGDDIRRDEFSEGAPQKNNESPIPPKKPPHVQILSTFPSGGLLPQILS